MTEAALTAVNHAAAQNDRWLFIGTLVVLGLFVIGVARYFMKQHQQLIDDHKASRDKSQAVIETIVEKQNETSQEITKVLALNTNAMQQNKVATEQNTQVIRDCMEVMKGCSTELRLCREK